MKLRTVRHRAMARQLGCKARAHRWLDSTTKALAAELGITGKPWFRMSLPKGLK